MKKVLVFCSILIFVAAASAFANQTATFDWEDGTTTALGTYGGNIALANSTEQAHGGTYSLKMTESPLSGTPQAFIWWVTGLTDGDQITASFYVYDTTPSANPSGRIWAHSTPVGGVVTDYGGSLSGNSTYSDGTGWSLMSYTWTFDSSSGANDGFVLEARIYSGTDGDSIYIDDTAIDVSSDTATVYDASGATVPVELQSFSVE